MADEAGALDRPAVASGSQGLADETAPARDGRGVRARRSCPSRSRVDGDGVEASGPARSRRCSSRRRSGSAWLRRRRYGPPRRRIFAKLGTLGAGGPVSTATTILGAGGARAAAQTLDARRHRSEAPELHRQPAGRVAAGRPLQRLRRGRPAARRAAAERSSTRADGLAHDELAAAGVRRARPAGRPTTRRRPRVRSLARRTGPSEALRDVLGYRLYRDQERAGGSPRRTSSRPGCCASTTRTSTSSRPTKRVDQGAHRRTVARRRDTRDARAGLRGRCSTTCAASWRSRSTCLDATAQERSSSASSQQLIEPWAIDENEPSLPTAKFAAIPRLDGAPAGDDRGWRLPAAAAAFGQFLRRRGTFERCGSAQGRRAERDHRRHLLEALRRAGLRATGRRRPRRCARGYQLRASRDAAGWPATARAPSRPDPRAPAPSDDGPTDERRSSSTSTATSRSTAPGSRRASTPPRSTPRSARSARTAFRDGELPVLFCSPTMELGVDIAELNVVNMRNVPPTPANYAQRSGAPAERPAALVFTYCSTGSRTTSTSSAARADGRRAGRRPAPRPRQRGPRPRPRPRDLAGRDGRRPRLVADRTCSTVDGARHRPFTLREPLEVKLSTQAARDARTDHRAERVLARRRSGLDATRRGGSTTRGSTTRCTAARTRFERRRERWREPLPRRARRPTRRRTRSSLDQARSPKRERNGAKRLRARGRGTARAAAQRRPAAVRSPTSTATATSPARASCPATPSRGCRCRRSSPAGARPAGTDACVTGRGSSRSREFGPQTFIYHEARATPSTRSSCRSTRHGPRRRHALLTRHRQAAASAAATSTATRTPPTPGPVRERAARRSAPLTGTTCSA